MPNIKRCCGTCAYWSKEDDGLPYRQCEWEPTERMPFWASLNRGRDHDDSTAAEQGAHCATWAAATRLVQG